MRYRSKQELEADIVSEHQALDGLLRKLPESSYGEPGVWGDDWTVCDLIAHLAEWHRMLLGWWHEGREGGTPAMPAPGYKWNETPRLNRAIWEKHRGRAFSSVKDDYESTHRGVLDLVRELSEADLFEPGRFRWTGRNALVTYVGANTASHYRFAQKVIKRWQRGGGRAVR